jgi:hypothetical protein
MNVRSIVTDDRPRHGSFGQWFHWFGAGEKSFHVGKDNGVDVDDIGSRPRSLQDAASVASLFITTQGDGLPRGRRKKRRLQCPAAACAAWAVWTIERIKGSEWPLPGVTFFLSTTGLSGSGPRHSHHDPLGGEERDSDQRTMGWMITTALRSRCRQPEK